MPLTAEQAKQAVTETILGAIQSYTTMLVNSLAEPDPEKRQIDVGGFEAAVAHLRQTEATAHRLVDRAFADPASEPKTTEPDDDYRKRLMQTVGTGSVNATRVQTATGRDLDDIGAHYGIKRK